MQGTRLIFGAQVASGLPRYAPGTQYFRHHHNVPVEHGSRGFCKSKIYQRQVLVLIIGSSFQSAPQSRTAPCTDLMMLIEVIILVVTWLQQAVGAPQLSGAKVGTPTARGARAVAGSKRLGAQERELEGRGVGVWAFDCMRRRHRRFCITAAS